MHPRCKIENCDKPSATRGWCWKHHSRWRRHGDPLHGDAEPPKPRESADAVSPRVKVTPRCSKVRITKPDGRVVYQEPYDLETLRAVKKDSYWGDLHDEESLAESRRRGGDESRRRAGLG